MQGIAGESIAHIDQLFLVDGVRRGDKSDKTQNNDKKRFHVLPAISNPSSSPRAAQAKIEAGVASAEPISEAMACA
jgi:hypothetical protein